MTYTDYSLLCKLCPGELAWCLQQSSIAIVILDWLHFHDVGKCQYPILNSSQDQDDFGWTCFVCITSQTALIKLSTLLTLWGQEGIRGQQYMSTIWYCRQDFISCNRTLVLFFSVTIRHFMWIDQRIIILGYCMTERKLKISIKILFSDYDSLNLFTNMPHE